LVYILWKFTGKEKRIPIIYSTIGHSVHCQNPVTCKCYVITWVKPINFVLELINLLDVYAISASTQIFGHPCNLFIFMMLYMKFTEVILRYSKFRFCIWHSFQAIPIFSNFRKWKYTSWHLKWRHIYRENRACQSHD